MNIVIALVLAICMATTLSLISQTIFYLTSYILAAKIYNDPTTRINKYNKIEDIRIVIVALSWGLFYYLIHI